MAEDHRKPKVSEKVSALIEKHGLKPGDARFMEDEHAMLHAKKVERAREKDAKPG